MRLKIGRLSLPLAALCATAFLAAPLAAPRTAHASAKGRKNTTIALGALAAHQLLTGKTTNGLLLGAGTAYAYSRYNSARKDENRRRAYSAYNRYNDGRNYGSNRYSDRYRSRTGGSNRYDRDRSHRRTSYSRSHRNTPPGWSKGRKTGWGGRSMPPGQAKKYYKKHHKRH